MYTYKLKPENVSYLCYGLQEGRLPHLLPLLAHRHLHASLFVLDVSSFLFQFHSDIVELDIHHVVRRRVVFTNAILLLLVVTTLLLPRGGVGQGAKTCFLFVAVLFADDTGFLGVLVFVVHVDKLNATVLS